MSWSLRSKYSGTATAVRDSVDCALLFHTISARSAKRYGSGRNSTALSALKIAVLAPMARPIVRTATMAKSGDRRSVRSANATSMRSSCQSSHASHVGLHVGSNSAALVAYAVDVAEACARRGAGVGLGHAGVDVAPRLQLEVRAELVGDLALDRDGQERAAQPARERQAVGNHVAFITLATAAVKLSHSADSARSCARPLVVNE